METQPPIIHIIDLHPYTYILLMEEILHQLNVRLSHYLHGFIHPSVVWNFFHQPYH